MFMCSRLIWNACYLVVNHLRIHIPLECDHRDERYGDFEASTDP